MPIDSSIIEQSLSRLWPEVRQLTPMEALAVLDDFLRSCVKPDFAKKFISALDGPTPITRRFFKRCRQVPDAGSVRFALGIRVAIVTAQIIWGAPNKAFGFYIVGPSELVNSLFVVEGDGIAHLQWDAEDGYVFLSGARGEYYVGGTA